MDLKELVAAELEAVRARTLTLVDPVPEEEQVRQQSPLMSPLIWDLAHVGNYEELWLLRVIAGFPGTSNEYDDMYNPFVHPRFSRVNLPLLGPQESRSYISEVRGRVIDVLDSVELDPSNPLTANAFVYGMVVQHEHQHDETMLATRQLMLDRAIPLETPPAPRSSAVPSGEVRVEGGAFTMGTDIEPWAYDNERPAHEVVVEPFFIDKAPVTNAQYIDFISAGGYEDRRFWTDEGWQHRVEERLEHPLFWQQEGDGSWSTLRFGRRTELRSNEPVQHVCWFEADAYARWAGKRLPTEAEWEKAAAWEPGGTKRRYPWGNDLPDESNSNLGQRHDGPAEVGAYPAGVSPWGCHQMIGDVWEWTSSDFVGYPGFETFPYKEYSEVFFGGDYKVLRGGAWATHPQAVRSTFRNWDYPIRRQIFAGFRCARDA
ncbi:MAG: ergothioneine biosynthesis protein EgtB [Actinomycetota bacterium]|nr:ergothioneine biosynthesis protein EgtB [Actinomycetota bacterium]